MIARLSDVCCDVCGDSAEPADAAAEARQLTKREGYVQRDGRDLRQDCHAALADPVPVGGPPVPCGVILQPLGEPLDCVFHVYDRVTVDYTSDGRPIWGHKPGFKRVGVEWRGRRVYDTVVLCECARFQSQQPNRNDARWEWRKHVRAATGQLP